MHPVRIIQRTTGPFNLNTYLVICPETRETVLIDPGGQTDVLVDLIREQDLSVLQILNTHGHTDQFFSTREFKQAIDVPSCLHQADNRFFSDPEIQKEIFREIGLPPPYPADIELRNEDVIPFGSLRLTVIHTPGHTPGSACFYSDGHLFAGDTLFVGEAGRTDLPGGDLGTLIESIRTRILSLPETTVLHPGHSHGDEKSSTLAREKETNPYITDFILDV